VSNQGIIKQIQAKKIDKLFVKTTILTLAMSVIFYAHSATNGVNNNMIKLVFVLKITDEEKYRDYRKQIKPLMNKLNIIVMKEYRISKTVHSDNEADSVNMLAMFGFPSLEIKEKFFSSNVYQNAKKVFAASTSNFEKLIEE